MENEPEIDDAEIRAGQWKNCIGCIIGVIFLITVALLALRECNKM